MTISSPLELLLYQYSGGVQMSLVSGRSALISRKLKMQKVCFLYLYPQNTPKRGMNRHFQAKQVQNIQTFELPKQLKLWWRSGGACLLCSCYVILFRLDIVV